MVAKFPFSPRVSSFRVVTFSKHFFSPYMITMRARRAAKTRWKTESAGNRTFFTLPSHGKKARSLPFPRAVPLSSPCPFLRRERPSLSPDSCVPPPSPSLSSSIYSPKRPRPRFPVRSRSLSLSLSLAFSMFCYHREDDSGRGRTRGNLESVSFSPETALDGPQKINEATENVVCFMRESRFAYAKEEKVFCE